MALKSFTQNATASISASGTSTSTGSITWSIPALPEGATKWDSVRISGTWTWSGKGNVSRVTINGTNTTASVPFDIAIPVTQSSPLSITCVGNKNATGSNFRWSNLVVTYVCIVLGAEVLYVKKNGAWVEVSAVYKKIDGVWVLQEDLAGLFDTNTIYVKE